MSETCLSNGKLAAVIFGSIFGTLLICGVFVVLLWQWFKKHRNDSKIFYVERVEKEPAKDVELGQDYTDQPKEQVESTEKKNDAQQTNSNEQKTITQKSIVLNEKRYSTPSSLNNQLTNNPPKVLPNLGVTIAKMPRSGFQITSVEKVESRFVPSDLVTELAISLDQMSLEDAASLLELLVPYRIQLEVLRSNSELESSTIPNENTVNEKINAEVHKDTVNDAQTNGVEEVPRLPSVSPPTSPPPANVDSQSPSNLPIPPDTKRDSKSSSDEDQQSTAQRSARHATRIPTPKSARNSNRSTLESFKDQNEQDIFNRAGHQKDFSYSTKRDVLVVSNEETDEFGLTSEQYETLENNRQRLEREKQALREMGILS